MHIAHIIFRFKYTFLQIAAPPKATCPPVVVCDSDSVIEVGLSTTVVGDAAPFVDKPLTTSVVAPGPREMTVPDTVMGGPPGVSVELPMV
jgi:hypothetical protein